MVMGLNFLRSLRAALIAVVPACASTRPAEDSPGATVRWVPPAQAVPHGQAPGARTRLLAAQPDGTKSYVLVLREGDEVATALANFADDQHVVNAHFVAIGAVRDPEVAWFDPMRHEYKAISRHEQMEVLTLSGDIALAADDRPVVH